jgi:hypothetical protein
MLMSTTPFKQISIRQSLQRFAHIGQPNPLCARDKGTNSDLIAIAMTAQHCTGIRMATVLQQSGLANHGSIGDPSQTCLKVVIVSVRHRENQLSHWSYRPFAEKKSAGYKKTGFATNYYTKKVP